VYGYTTLNGVINVNDALELLGKETLSLPIRLPGDTEENHKENSLSVVLYNGRDPCLLLSPVLYMQSMDIVKEVE
jgi:hypothetical protein